MMVTGRHGKLSSLRGPQIGNSGHARRASPGNSSDSILVFWKHSSVKASRQDEENQEIHPNRTARYIPQHPQTSHSERRAKQIFHGLSLLLELGRGGEDPGFEVVIDLEVFADRPAVPVGGEREAVDQPRGHAVAAV